MQQIEDNNINTTDYDATIKDDNINNEPINEQL
jgi:hypothetical protein